MDTHSPPPPPLQLQQEAAVDDTIGIIQLNLTSFNLFSSVVAIFLFFIFTARGMHHIASNNTNGSIIIIIIIITIIIIVIIVIIPSSNPTKQYQISNKQKQKYQLTTIK